VKSALTDISGLTQEDIAAIDSEMRTILWILFIIIAI
jgi:hypothetical protein